MTGGTHYDTLGLPPDATAAEIREAYVRLREARRQSVSTRLVGSRQPDAAPAELTRAYQVLADPRARAAHDWRLGIDDLQPLDWGGAAPEPHTVEVSSSGPRQRRLS